ncbi:MAG: AMP-binding protein [Pseudomonadota bacterium]
MTMTRPWTQFYGETAQAVDEIKAPPLISIETLMENAVAAYGDAPFVTTVLPNGANATLSFKEVATASRDFAAYLQSVVKLPKGAVIAVQAPNCIAYTVAMIGVLRAGFILSNVNPLYTAKETRQQLEDCGAQAIIFADLFGDQIETATDGRDDIHLIKVSVTDFFPPLKKAVLDAALKYVRRLVPAMNKPHTNFLAALKQGRGHAFSPPSAEAANDTTADFYQYSGGTTGRSKGVQLSFAGLMHNISQVNALQPDVFERRNSVTLLVLPLYHMFGFYMAVSALRLGGHLILAPSPRPLSNLKPAFEKFAPDVFPGVNTLFAYLAQEPWFSQYASHIELTVTGAMALNPSVAREWRELTGSQIVESYGMTETTTVLSSNPPGPTYREGSVGLPIPGSDIAILKDDDSWAATGEPGEIVARGPQVMTGYLNAPELNAAAFHDGWLRTGDIGYLDEDGYLFLVDRKKDLIIVSGFNVFPGEIESVVADHPGVLEAAVVGAPDAASGERPIAFVVRSDPAVSVEGLKDHCAAQLTNYKRPRDFRFIDALPKSPVGKVLRRELRDLL